MFNLLVKITEWADGRDSIPLSRAFEYTSRPLLARFKPKGEPDFDSLLNIPTVFMQETSAEASHQIVRVGTLLNAYPHGKELVLEYAYDSTIPSVTNETIQRSAAELGIDEWEFSRTHWAIKEADLFRALTRHIAPRRLRPRVFSIADPERIEPTLVSAMMPFHPSFDEVYGCLRSLAESLDLRLRRADDIWENPAVMQDVVSLIDRSKIVICDCTGRNPNVFYEIGIAHTLGREVILITQLDSDIPFDLRHLRYVTYMNNGEGRKQLRSRLQPRMESLTAR